MSLSRNTSYFHRDHLSQVSRSHPFEKTVNYFALQIKYDRNIDMR